MIIIRDELIDSFDTRTKNALARNGILNTEQLLQKTEIDLLHFTYLGAISVARIITELDKRGLKLKEDADGTFSAVYVPKKEIRKLQEQKALNLKANKKKSIFNIFKMRGK